jgi:hypothetical protein
MGTVSGTSDADVAPTSLVVGSDKGAETTAVATTTAADAADAAAPSRMRRPSQDDDDDQRQRGGQRACRCEDEHPPGERTPRLGPESRITGSAVTRPGIAASGMRGPDPEPSGIREPEAAPLLTTSRCVIDRSSSLATGAVTPSAAGTDAKGSRADACKCIDDDWTTVAGSPRPSMTSAMLDGIVHSDSTYFLNGSRTGWLTKRARHGWLNASRKPVVNRDLWRDLQAAVAKHEVGWRWVKRHGNYVEHNRCDELAVEALKRYAEERASSARADG